MNSCPGNKRCHLASHGWPEDFECINGVAIDVDEWQEGHDESILRHPAPCHPHFCKACGGSGEFYTEEGAEDCPHCSGTGYRNGKNDSIERLNSARGMDEEDGPRTNGGGDD